jgi:hypothetical protein
VDLSPHHQVIEARSRTELSLLIMSLPASRGTTIEAICKPHFIRFSRIKDGLLENVQRQKLDQHDNKKSCLFNVMRREKPALSS